jgi:hypothetical protein
MGRIKTLERQTDEILSIHHIFTYDEAPVNDVKDVLKEVDKTYRAVMDAITRFTAPAISKDSFDCNPYNDLASGILQSDIENGRGHCTLIKNLYRKPFGMRDWIKDNLKDRQEVKKVITELDSVFSQFSEADDKIFSPMVEVGKILTNESRVIVNLTLSGQEELARSRIIEGRKQLEPLIESISSAQDELRNLETKYGFVL